MASTSNDDSSKTDEESMTIQEKRKKLLREKQTQRIKQQEAMGLSPERHSKKSVNTFHPLGVCCLRSSPMFGTTNGSAVHLQEGDLASFTV